MAKLIKQGQWINDDPWQIIEDEQDIQDFSIISLTRWQADKDSLQALASSGKLGLWLDSHESPDLLNDECHLFTVIAVNFPVFTDGRGYSTARLLRQRHFYKGELRAIGDVLLDQLYLLKRVGFDAFAMREDQNMERVLQSFKPFSNAYQSDVHETRPLFRRRQVVDRLDSTHERALETV